MIIEFKIAIIAFVWCEILTDEDMIFHLIRKLPDFLSCPYCIAGQLSLIYNCFCFTIIFELIHSVFFTIFVVHLIVIFDNLYKHFTNK